jgi:hypothetical protein
MGTNTPQRAAEEAAFVAETLGASLQYFQIGNEADFFGRHNMRDPKTWSATTYLNEWLTLARAVTSRVSGAKFGMPDVGSESILHGGAGKSVANSVGGFLPRDILLKEKGESPELITTHPHPLLHTHRDVRFRVRTGAGSLWPQVRRRV